MIIRRPSLDGSRVSFQVDDRYLVYKVNDPSLVSEGCDAALIALLIPAMRAGESVTVDGPVSNKLFAALPRLQAVLRSVIPYLKTVNVNAPERTACVRASGVATGFSGGVDSFCVVADHRHRLTHLLFNDVGSHGFGAEHLFRQRLARLTPVAAQLDLPLVTVSSNLDDFYVSSLGFQQTHTLRNASVALLLSRGLGEWLYASAFHYRDIHTRESYDLATADPVTLPLACTEAIELVPVGSEYTRVEKTLRILDVRESHDHLDVCVNDSYSPPPINCSICWKCLRTLATLEVVGGLTRYSQVFDLDAYDGARVKYFAEVLSSTDPLIRELRQLAKDRAFQPPLASRLIHRFKLRRPIRKARHLSKRLRGLF